MFQYTGDYSATIIVVIALILDCYSYTLRTTCILDVSDFQTTKRHHHGLQRHHYGLRGSEMIVNNRLTGTMELNVIPV